MLNDTRTNAQLLDGTIAVPLPTLPPPPPPPLPVTTTAASSFAINGTDIDSDSDADTKTTLIITFMTNNDISGNDTDNIKDNDADNHICDDNDADNDTDSPNTAAFTRWERLLPSGYTKLPPTRPKLPSLFVIDVATPA